MSNPMTAEQKKQIDNSSYMKLLIEWRFAQPGRFTNDDERSEYFQKVMFEKRDADIRGSVQASKIIGWDKGGKL